MGRLASGLTGLALTATLTACGSEAAPAPAPTPTKTASPAPSPSPSASIALTPPVMPEAAKAHTRAGAKSFVVYYWQVVDYAQLTLDTRLLKALSDPTCRGCQAGIATIDALASKHASVNGGAETIFNLAAAPITIRGRPVFVTFEVTHQGQRIHVPGEKDTVHKSGTSKVAMSLIPNARGWAAGELRGNG